MTRRNKSRSYRIKPQRHVSQELMEAIRLANEDIAEPDAQKRDQATPQPPTTPIQPDRETVETSSGIQIGINYLPSPLALSVIVLAKPREIYRLLIKPPDNLTLKQAGYENSGKGKYTTGSTFQELRAAPWLTPKGKHELEAIAEALKQRIDDIEDHLDTTLYI